MMPLQPSLMAPQVLAQSAMVFGVQVVIVPLPHCPGFVGSPPHESPALQAVLQLATMPPQPSGMTSQ